MDKTRRLRALARATIQAPLDSPSVAGARLFSAGYFGDEATPRAGEDRITCLDAETGEEFRWRFESIEFEDLDPEIFELPEELRKDG